MSDKGASFGLTSPQDPRTALKATVAALVGGQILFPDSNGLLTNDSNLRNI